MGAFLHRFIVLELHRQGRKPVYLRLDRRLGKGASTFSLIRSSGSTPANDVAQFASFKKDLMTGARLENKQLFENVPTLGELRHFLLVICDEIKTYQVWPVCDIPKRIGGST
ncbi:hypothetical protein DL93DRAFT_794271 [Clavulina sp. PMI_390]|nr:hypothetical protein DL93DRAFT_794271 [Clavulina sp. PMI_390]